MKVNLGRDSSGRPLVVDRQALRMLHEAGRLAGGHFTITQGSYMAGHGADASSDTHDKAGAVDLRVWDLAKQGISVEEAVAALRKVGFAAWHRGPQHGFSEEHIHAVVIGMDGLSRGAAQQVRDYFAGKDGLADHGPDYNRRPKVIRTWREYKALRGRRAFLRNHPRFRAAVDGTETRRRRFIRRHPKIAAGWTRLGGS